MSEQQPWVKLESIRGGWIVVCRLCGNHVKRTFVGSNTNYAEAERGSRDYYAKHLESEGHLAALRAFHSSEPPRLTVHEALLAEVFGDMPDEIELRRRAAKDAAKQVLYGNQRRKKV